MIHFQEKYYIEIFDSSRVIPLPPTLPPLTSDKIFFFQSTKLSPCFELLFPLENWQMGAPGGRDFRLKSSQKPQASFWLGWITLEILPQNLNIIKFVLKYDTIILGCRGGEGVYIKLPHYRIFYWPNFMLGNG